MSEKKKAGRESTPPTLGVSVVILTTQMETTTTVVIAPTLGVPIMREGFVTETGLLLSSSDVSTAIVSTSPAHN